MPTQKRRRQITRPITSIFMAISLSACAGQMRNVQKISTDKKYTSIYIEVNTAESRKLKITRNKAGTPSQLNEAMNQSISEFNRRVKKEIPEKLGNTYKKHNIKVVDKINNADLIFKLKTPETLDVIVASRTII
ncbi:hypothetical protein [Jeongeupia sp. USM3]|uniref:hypothetical protein n=1 Tax=Jeongeupia sp. USM3 TaxID=1906741 RepID=UPI0011AB7513|nr:hypothetical protein [Jeongeupia sp. USM3]